MPVFTLCLSGYISIAESPQYSEFIMQCLSRNIAAHLQPASPPRAEGSWLATRLAQTGHFSLPLQTICNTRLHIVFIFSLNCTKANPRVCKQSCMDVGNPSYHVENKLCKC